ncbi:hypothetical protein [Rhodanobacter sp. C01]|uniref:hypothetical protein n=1 Tax=Rhodanobacter sp. C01 TaxID=1945856 RepID=UPI001115699F|nr:hypothetical protein [Rhodanobacter sp. C01]
MKQLHAQKRQVEPSSSLPDIELASFKAIDVKGSDAILLFLFVRQDADECATSLPAQKYQADTSTQRLLGTFKPSVSIANPYKRERPRNAGVAISDTNSIGVKTF